MQLDATFQERGRESSDTNRKDRHRRKSNAEIKQIWRRGHKPNQRTLADWKLEEISNGFSPGAARGAAVPPTP